jgi:hypothetical protein
MREIISRGGHATGPRGTKNTDKSFCVTLDIAAAASSADKAVNAADLVIERLLARGKSTVISPKSNRKAPCDLDKEVHKAATSRISSAPLQRHSNRER